MDAILVLRNERLQEVEVCIPAHGLELGEFICRLTEGLEAIPKEKALTIEVGERFAGYLRCDHCDNRTEIEGTFCSTAFGRESLAIFISASMTDGATPESVYKYYACRRLERKGIIPVHFDGLPKLRLFSN
jgi:hypothetical protein